VVSGLYTGKRYFKDRNLTPTQKYISSIIEDFNVRRHFDGRAWGSFWDHCGVTLTADHVPAAMADDGTAFVGQPVTRSLGLIDAAHYGEWECGKPRDPAIGESVWVIGYPGGSLHPSYRKGEIYLKREESGSPDYEHPTWIAVLHTDEPVVGGMSGGIVISEDGTPLGILVTQNSSTYIEKFQSEKHSSDFVALSDYWRTPLIR